MTAHNFHYQLNDASGNPVATVTYGSENGEKDPAFRIHFSENVSEHDRKDALDDYHNLAGVLKFKSEIPNSNDVVVQTDGRFPDALMLYVGKHLAADHDVPPASLEHYEDYIKHYDGNNTSRLIKVFASVEAAHHGNTLAQYNVTHTSHNDHHHNPAEEKVALDTRHAQEEHAGKFRA